jgi:hypothetical protein
MANDIIVRNALLSLDSIIELYNTSDQSNKQEIRQSIKRYAIKCQ